MKYKICPDCGERYPDNKKHFHKTSSKCKGCHAIYNFINLEVNKEARRKYFREYVFLFGTANKVPALNKIKKSNLAKGKHWKDRVQLRENYLQDYSVYKKVKL